MALNYNISAVADNQPTVYVRWGMGITDNLYNYCGWNIDDITFTGVDEFTLTVNTTGSGSVTRDPDQATYTLGQEVELTAIADPHWQFDHWSGDLTGSNNPETITIDGDMTVTAVFVEEQHSLTVNVDGYGIVFKDPDQPTYTYGQVVTLSAYGGPGWVFDEWSGDLTGSNNPEQIVMDGDKTVTAHFTQEPPPDCPEDLYVDGVINLSDLGVLLGAYGSTSGDPNWNPYADFDGSGQIDLADLGTLLAVYGQDCPTR